MPIDFALMVRKKGDRRRVARGGRRANDRLSLTPELRADAADYADVIERCSKTFTTCLADDDVVGARLASRTIQEASDKLRRLLTVAHP